MEVGVVFSRRCTWKTGNDGQLSAKMMARSLVSLKRKDNCCEPQALYSKGQLPAHETGSRE